MSESTLFFWLQAVGTVVGLALGAGLVWWQKRRQGKEFFTLLLLCSACVPCQAGPSEKAALQILTRLHREAIWPDRSSWERLTDGKTGKTWSVFWFAGGTPCTADGAVGYFDSKGRLVGAKHIKRLSDFNSKGSVFTSGDSLRLVTLDSAGTGIKGESIVILTLHGGRWLESFRCPGDYHCEMGFAVSTRDVHVRLQGLPGSAPARIARVVEENEYATSDDYEARKPSSTKRYTETYRLDAAKMRFVKDP